MFDPRNLLVFLPVAPTTTTVPRLLRSPSSDLIHPEHLLVFLQPNTKLTSPLSCLPTSFTHRTRLEVNIPNETDVSPLTTPCSIPYTLVSLDRPSMTSQVLFLLSLTDSTESSLVPSTYLNPTRRLLVTRDYLIYFPYTLST